MSVYQHVGALATTALVTREGEGPQGNFPTSGGADAHTQIEAAWTYVVALGGGEVTIGAGDFGGMSATIDSQGAYVAVRGMGYGTYLRTSGAFHVFSISGHDYVSIENLRLAQQSSGNSNDAVLIEDGADYFRFENLWIVDSDRNGIMITGTSIVYGWILNCYFVSVDEMNIRTDLDPANDVKYLIIQNNVFNGGQRGINVEATYYAIIDSNIGLNTTWDFCSGGGFYWMVISNNIAYDSNNAFAVAWGTGATVISGNIAYSPAGNGLNFSNTNYLVASNNIIYDPDNNGIQFDDCDYCSCLGNTIYSSANDGIYHDAGTDSPLFTCIGNTVILSAGTGIWIQDVNRALINNNFIYDSSEHGIADLADNSIVNGNYSYSAGWQGIHIQNFVLCVNNYLISSGSNGIRGTNIDNSYVAFNYSVSNSGYGILINSDADDNVIYGNYTRANSSGCMRVDNANCDDNIIWANSFDEGNISDIGTGTCAFDNFDPSANNWIASIAPPAGGR